MIFVLRLLLLIIPFSLFGVNEWEDTKSPFYAKVTISNDHITIKDKLIVNLVVTFPKGYLLDGDIVRAHLLQQSGFNENPFKLSKETVYPPSAISQNQLQQRFTYELNPLLTGTYYLSFFNLPFHKEKETFNFYTYVFPIHVVEGNEEEIETMQSPLMNFDATLPIALSPENRRHLLQNPQVAKSEIAHNQRRIDEKTIPWLAILSVLLAGLFIALSVKKEEKPETKAQKEQKIRTLREKALEELSAVPLENTDLFYTDMSNTVRHYIENKYQVPVTSKTTEEFMQDLGKQQLFGESEQYLMEDFLTHADRVKFAQYTPTQKEKENALSAAKKFILES